MVKVMHNNSGLKTNANPLQGFAASRKVPFYQRIHPAVWFSISALFLCVTLGILYLKQSGKPWEPGAVEVENTRAALIKASARLESFDSKGDRAGAVGMLDTATYLLRNIDSAPFQSQTMKNCQLAAAHLADGVLSVSQGGTWSAKTRFENALDDCK